MNGSKTTDKFKVHLRKKLPTSLSKENFDSIINHMSKTDENDSCLQNTNANDDQIDEIAHFLNIPNNILSTPKRNFNTYSKFSENHREKHSNADDLKSDEIENDAKIVNNNNLNSEELSAASQSDYANSNSYSRTYDFERFEARRRLELLKQKADLVDKFTKATLQSLDDEDDHLNDKVHNLEDSEIDKLTDSFEPRYVKEINFEILKHPSSQQQISVQMLSSDRSAPTKSLKKNTRSCPRARLKRFPCKKDSKSALNLDSKMSSVADYDQTFPKPISISEEQSKMDVQNRSASYNAQKFDKFEPKSNLSLLEKEAALEKIDALSSDERSETGKGLDNQSDDLEHIQKLAYRSISKHIDNDQSVKKNKNFDFDDSSSKIALDRPNVLKIKKISVNNKSYQVLNKIGKGGSSIVYQVYCQESQKILALKMVDLKNADSSILNGFRSEINLLKRLSQCERVVKMFDFEFRDHNKDLLIVLEKGDADLSNVLKTHSQSKQNKLSPHLIKLYWQEMLEAVKEIHSHNIVHSDLKPVNFILVSGKLKLIDFGIANTIQADQTNVYKETIIVDIWSLGIILYNLVYGVTPFSRFGSDNIRKSIAIINGNIEYGPIEDQLLLDVIKNCLQINPLKRPSAVELLNHPYLISTNAKDSKEIVKELPSKNSNFQLPDNLLDQIRNLTPNTLKTFSMF
ncbi:dual specificity protein kinase TTK-like protein [Sarcoptes scabiei]|uniref:Dual specificity protein kinase TTK-like protein n=1 Tax=Sarcoptes scabiei TaxID=52283 RepID=A0A131ZWF7_SARSC|nr:dual specificity protein kinase TTK-like protein [Sarcoptes scabiei]